MTRGPACGPPIPGSRLAFSIPGEITDGFLSQIAMFALALRRQPPPLGQARVIAYLGCEAATTIPARWRPHLADVDIRLVHRPASEAAGIVQAPRRFAENDPSLDYVILCDADTMILGDLSDVLMLLYRGFPVAGLIAHSPPSPTDDWPELSTRLTGTPIPQPYVYTLMDPVSAAAPGPPRAPFYVNHGFLAFRADALRELSAPYLDMRAAVAGVLRRPFFTGQVALTLTLHKLGWRGAPLPMRYNYPNDDRALALHAHEALDVRVLHYLRERLFTRDRLFADPGIFNGFLAARPQDSDRLVHDALTAVTGGTYPF